MKTVLIIIALLMGINLQSQILSYTSFRTPAQVDAAINTLHSAYPALTTIQTLGNSYEGRPIKGLRISNSPINDPSKGDVVYMSLIHAREWITVESLLYIADKMLAQYSTNTQLQNDMKRLQIWIIPVCNPDGYAYTATGGSCSDPTSPRMWRKNRRNNGDGTHGVDLNRNWGYQWGLLSGSSNITSSDTYHGTALFSEPETQVLRNFISGLTNLKVLVSYHSFSELYLRVSFLHF